MTRAMLIVAGLSALLALYLGYVRLTSTDLDLQLSGSEPFGVRFALIDDQPGSDPNTADGEEELAALAQAIIWPEQKRVLFYFMNTAARFAADEEPLSEMSPGSADRFRDFTEIRSDYSIAIRRSQAERLLNFLEGMTLIVEEPQEFPNTRFQYPRGVRFYPGEQIMEYALAKRAPDRDLSKFYVNPIEQVYRIQSVLLNLYWRIDEYREKLADEQVQQFAAGLVDSNMDVEELVSLFAFMNLENAVHISVLEVPLELGRGPRSRRDDRLVVNPTRGRVVFREFGEELKAEQSDTDLFPIEVLNGTEVGGLARRVKQFLQDRSLQVLDADNYPYKPLAKSFIVSRSGDTFITNRLLDITALERTRVVFNRAALDVDASFIIGTDFDTKQLRLR